MRVQDQIATLLQRRREQFLPALSQDRMQRLRIDEFGEGLEDETAGVHFGMRNDEFRP